MGPKKYHKHPEIRQSAKVGPNDWLEEESDFLVWQMLHRNRYWDITDQGSQLKHKTQGDSQVEGL